MLIALGIENDFDVHQMDIKIVFLLQYAIYMEQPQGSIQL